MPRRRHCRESRFGDRHDEKALCPSRLSSGRRVRRGARSGLRPAARYPFNDPALPMEKRIDNLLSLMTVEEKIGCLGTNTGVPRLGVTELLAAPKGFMESCSAKPGASGCRLRPRSFRSLRAWANRGILTWFARRRASRAMRPDSSPRPQSTTGRSSCCGDRSPIWPAIRAGDAAKKFTGKTRSSTEPWLSPSSRACKGTTRSIGKRPLCSSIFWPTATRIFATAPPPTSTSGCSGNTIRCPSGWAFTRAARRPSWLHTTPGTAPPWPSIRS